MPERDGHCDARGEHQAVAQHEHEREDERGCEVVEQLAERCLHAASLLQGVPRVSNEVLRLYRLTVRVKCP